MPITEDIWQRLAEGHLQGAELLECARQAMQDPSDLQEFRARWRRCGWPVLGDYHCLECLGSGASGVVYKALWMRDEPRWVALKILQFATSDQQERFRTREIAILKSLNCPNVCRYLDSGCTDSSTYYLAMELIEGQPLDQYLKENTATLEDKLVVFRRLCEVVAGFHRHGVIHRDLNPRHILVDRTGQPCVVDFGLSIAEGEDHRTLRAVKTELGRIMGTVKYMSPEQAWGGLYGADPRIDVWALGVMLFEIATDGDYPFQLEPLEDMNSQDSLLHRIRTEAPREPRIRPARHSEPLKILITRCLGRDLRDRLPSAGALADDLGRFLAQKTIRTAGFPLPHRARRIAMGMAVHWRGGLWAAINCAAVVMIFMLGVLLDSKVRAHGAPYEHAEVLVVGIGDQTVQRVPQQALELQIPGVTPAIITWRGVHGELMRRLAEAEPRAVAWDYFFAKPQPGDDTFAQGALVLHQAGIPVVLAVEHYTPEGRPVLSPALYDPLAEIAGHGMILACDMIEREGSFILAVRRGDRVLHGFALAVFAAVRHAECQARVEWAPYLPAGGSGDTQVKGQWDKTLQVVYQPRTPGIAPASDTIPLSCFYETRRQRHGTRPTDWLGLSDFALRKPDYWRSRTIPYEELLAMPAQELRERVAGRIVLIGDVRSPHLFQARDLHDVRHGQEIIKDVPGCYLLADAIVNLLANRHLAPASRPVLRPDLMAGVALCALFACLGAPRLARSPHVQSRPGRAVLIVGLVMAGCGFIQVLNIARSWLWVSTAMFGTTICLATTFAVVIELARNRYRRIQPPPPPTTMSGLPMPPQR